MASEKVKFVQSIVEKLTELDLAKSLRRELYDIYWKRGYNSGGADPIVFTDYETSDVGYVSLSTLTDCITLLENEDKFWKGDTHTTAAYDDTINKVRKIP